MKITALLFLLLILVSCEQKDNATKQYKYRIVYQSDTCLCEKYEHGYSSPCIEPRGIRSYECAERYCGQLKAELINAKKP